MKLCVPLLHYPFKDFPLFFGQIISLPPLASLQTVLFSCATHGRCVGSVVVARCSTREGADPSGLQISPASVLCQCRLHDYITENIVL